MRRCRFDLRRGGLQIEQCPPARRARDIIRLENPRTGRLENIVTQPQGLPRRFLALYEDRVADSVAKQRHRI